MKKRWRFSVLALSIFLFFLPFVQSSSANFWIECKNSCIVANNACTGTGNKCCIYDENKDGQVCCRQGSGTWLTECTCTDADGDRYIREDTTIADCGNVCGTGTQSCLGNKDCDDNNVNINPVISESTNALCSDEIDNNCNKNNDAAWDDDATTGIDCQDLSCAGLTGPGSVTCCQTAADCGNDDCKTETCSSNECAITNRARCATDECSAGQYCDSAGGNCATPDASSPVCLNCVSDQTTGFSWTATNHQDAGKGFNANLFNSDAAACPASSCSDLTLVACACYNSTGTAVNHKGTFGSAACCGDDANEFYKPDYYGPECTNNVNDCVWSDGNAQASNTGNKEYWCYLHEWNICKEGDANTVAIGTRVGDIAGNNYVTCAGTAGNQKWTPNSLVLTENQYSCTDGLNNDGDANIDCADTDCAGVTGPNNKICCPNSVADCGDDDCKTETCSSNECTITNRAQCATNECSPGQYCDSLGGNCQTPDASSPVCLNCALDRTSGYNWTATNHEDAGKGFNANLFNSDAAACPASSCSDRTIVACACYDSNGTAVNHKATAGTAACCGDDANEFYKPDYYGPECTNIVNDCVWSDGNAQASNTGNKEYWCYLHEWNICKEGDASTVPIGTRVGPAGSQVTCAGTAGNQKWTPNSLVLTENQYSCTDGLDNDGDTNIDCADSDCAGTISGSVKDTDDNPIDSAEIDVLKNAIRVHTSYTDTFGNYLVNDSLDVICGNYDMIASASGYVSSAQSIELLPNEAKIVNFILVLGTTCEADCTYAGDDIIHRECQGINNCDLCNFGCAFCNPSIAANACNLAKIGWIRNYDDPAQPECQQTGCVIECGRGCPIAKIETRADVTCDEENLLKIIKLVTYKGKLAKLTIVVCG